MLTKHRGSVTLEFLLVMPVLLVVLLAVVQFGMFFSNMQQVALACRVGAETASRTDLSEISSGHLIPETILRAINAQLESSAISPCRIYLQHNATGIHEELVEVYDPNCACEAPHDPLPPQPPSDHGRLSVRVTLCVAMTELTPNVTGFLGFDLSGRHAKCSATFRYELSTP